MPNMAKHVARHNNKVLQQYLEVQHPQLRVAPFCNCQRSRKPDCPVPGKCTTNNVVYQAQVTELDSGNEEFYTGCTKRPIKKRVQEHFGAINKISNEGQTTFSTHVRKLKQDNIPHQIKWSVRDRGPPYNPTTKSCRLCLLEKYYIMFEPEKATLNQRSEFFGHCWHKAPQLLVKQK